MNETGNGYFKHGHTLSRGPRHKSLRRAVRSKIDEDYLDQYIAKSRQEGSQAMGKVLAFAEPEMPPEHHQATMESTFAHYPPEFWEAVQKLHKSFNPSQTKKEKKT